MYKNVWNSNVCRRYFVIAQEFIIESSVYAGLLRLALVVQSWQQPSHTWSHLSLSLNVLSPHNQSLNSAFEGCSPLNGPLLITEACNNIRTTKRTQMKTKILPPALNLVVGDVDESRMHLLFVRLNKCSNFRLKFNSTTCGLIWILISLLELIWRLCAVPKPGTHSFNLISWIG